MALKAIYENQDDIPESIENFRELFVEKNGKWELSGIAGVQTAANVQRLEVGLRKERDDHKATKVKLEAWGGMDHAETMTKLDRIPELELAADGKLDDAKVEEIAQRRADAMNTAKMAPLQRDLAKLTKERDDFGATVLEYRGKETRRSIHDATRKALTASKAIPEAHEDAMMLAERVFEITEEGIVQTRDGVGVTPGLDATAWLSEIQEKRPHWWPTSQGGGARGSAGGGTSFGKNPFTAEHWNATEQGKIISSKGMEVASRMAAAAGVTVGAAQPASKK